jgi:hypothetical protein
MSKETTYVGQLGEWQQLLTALLASIADLVHLEVPRAKLVALLARAIEITQLQAAQKTAKQETSQQLKVVMAEGQRLATVLRATLKEHYGPTSEKLTTFGVQPFRGRSRKTAPEPTSATPDSSGSQH